LAVVITGIIAATIAIAMIEVPSLVRRRLRKELWVFLTLLILGAGLSIAQSMHAFIPNPLDWMKTIYQPLGDALMGFYK